MVYGCMEIRGDDYFGFWTSDGIGEDGNILYHESDWRVVDKHVCERSICYVESKTTG